MCLYCFTLGRVVHGFNDEENVLRVGVGDVATSDFNASTATSFTPGDDLGKGVRKGELLL